MNLDVLAQVRPSARQLRWQRSGFHGFVHFGVNTVTDREWGTGHEDPAIFDPPDVDAGQWVDAMAAAGMGGVVLTAKHHDGFCLWPSAHTAHSVAASPWRGGRGDLVAEVATACAAAGLRFGIYLSPWDRADARYGTGRAYDDYFVAQLTELLTGYGEVFCVWLDGANGEGPDGRRQFHDWDRYHRVVRDLQPQAVIGVCGPDVRWCGNEAGHVRADEWSVVPHELLDAEYTASKSQQADDGRFSRRVRSDQEDLGSRDALAGYTGECVWYPAEVNTSIRPGWFHHPAQDDQVRSAGELFDLWRGAVGGNAGFLLNVPPTAQGRLAAPDVAALRGLGGLIAQHRAADHAAAATATVSSGDGSALAGEPAPERAPWRPDDDRPRLVLQFPGAFTCRSVDLWEDIASGQRIEEFSVVLHRDGREVWRGGAGVVGHLRMLDVPDVETDRIVVTLERFRARPALLGVRTVAGAARRRP
ncbi:alpha-L-fucosidase [Kineococcus sp. SYSU DK003]|uniref:alpha-L-fucosidase n=1 Tax=Kineococcus sp. SYSU DK003 TaxID=3383124 RepID=UPI003D7DE26E